jgi:hypothetical protein
MGTDAERREGRLLTPVGAVAGAWTCALAATALAIAVSFVDRRGGRTRDGLFNDFYDYWAAARILSHHGNPYDPQQVANVLGLEGVHSTIGTAYSYPLLLAELARPLGFLPSGLAAAVFTAGSLAALWLAVALLLSPLRAASFVELLLLATGAALFAPVVGTLYFGQVNLYVLPLLALAVRGLAPGANIALAAAVKLYPGTTMLAFLTRGRAGLRPLALTAAAAAALSVVPNAFAGVWPPAGTDRAMVGPDPFWSNESINGWLSRTLPPGTAVTPVMIAVCAILGLLVVGLVVARRDRPWPIVFGVLLSYGVVAAPKNSLWNFAPLLICGVCCLPAAGRRPATLALLALSWLLVTGQAVVDAAQSLHAGEPGRGPLSGMALYGGLLLLALLAHQLWTARPVEGADTRPRAEVLVA